MRLFILCIFCSIGLMRASGTYAQNARISLNAEAETVANVLKQIEEASDFSFFYNNTLLDLNRLVSVSAENEDIFSILDEVFAGTNVRYTVMDQKIILSNQPESAQQQGNTIQGTVVDAQGIPVIGASVRQAGTTNGVITDMDGNFKLTVPAGSKLEISYVGYTTQTLTVKAGTTQYNITLQEDTEMLDEVVVVGYGIQKKVNVIGSISTIDSEAMESRSVPDVTNMLTGLMPGVTITQSSGNPGQEAGTIRIRGVGSFGATPSPLVLVDGMPGSLSDLTPADIDNISVLKDASSAAIYGSRAANGVILVTTKKGKEGKARITYNGSVGMSQATELPDLAHSYEYAEFYNMAMGTETYTPEMIQKYRDGSDPDNYADEMYLDELLGGHSLQTKHELSVSGGSEKVQYMVSMGYLHHDGLLENNYYNRYNARVNLKVNLAKNLDLNARISGMTSDRHEPSTPGILDSGGYGGIITAAVRFPGLTPPTCKTVNWDWVRNCKARRWHGPITATPSTAKTGTASKATWNCPGSPSRA